MWGTLQVDLGAIGSTVASILPSVVCSSTPPESFGHWVLTIVVECGERMENILIITKLLDMTSEVAADRLNVAVQSLANCANSRLQRSFLMLRPLTSLI
jgi:hypothetical protein